MRSRAPAPPTGDALVRLFHVSKNYLAGGQLVNPSGTWALRDVSLELRRGEFAFLTGPSGAGKTTLMRLIFAEERPSEGQIVVLGRNVARLRPSGVAELRRRIGVVFQDFKLLPRRSVEDNVALALAVTGTPRREIRSRVFSMLKRVGLQHRRNHLTETLSGGEQQRVAVARALITDPDILIADEPTGNLDPDLTFEIMDLVAGAAARGTTVLVATHDLSLVDRYGKRRLRIEAGELVSSGVERR